MKGYLDTTPSLVTLYSSTVPTPPTHPPDILYLDPSHYGYTLAFTPAFIGIYSLALGILF